MVMRVFCTQGPELDKLSLNPLNKSELRMTDISMDKFLSQLREPIVYALVFIPQGMQVLCVGAVKRALHFVHVLSC
jgi:hypothetical protein